NGSETCSATSGCRPGTPVACADHSACTKDSCDEASRACVHDPQDCPQGGQELPLTSSLQLLASPTGHSSFKVDPGVSRVWMDVRQPTAQGECAVATPQGTLDESQVQYLAEHADMRDKDQLGGFMDAMTWTAPVTGTYTLNSAEPYLGTVIFEGGGQLLVWIDPLRQDRTVPPNVPVSLQARILDGNGEPMDDVNIIGTLAQTASADGTPIDAPSPLSVPLAHTGEAGRYQWTSSNLAAGVWSLKLHAENTALHRDLATSFAV